jgi:probable F420-dependent oxidoreductase
VNVGVLVRNFGGFPETGRGPQACVDLAVRADQLGFDSVWVTDHIVLPRQRRARYPHNRSGDFPYTWDQDIFDPLALMAGLAVATRRARIGTAVLVIPYRHPLTVAKTLATIDQLAAGRVILGAGVGWLRDEFDALQLPEEAFVHRGSVTEDYLAAMRAAWAAETTATHTGPFVSFSDVGAHPGPAQRPCLPIWIGGKGDQALRRAARLGDGYFAISSSPAELALETDRLRRLCAAAGRDPRHLTVALIEGIAVADRPVGGPPGLRGTPEQIRAHLEEYARAGLDHLVAGVRMDDDPGFDATVEALEVVAREILEPARHL